MLAVREPTAVMNQHKAVAKKHPVLTNYTVLIYSVFFSMETSGLPLSGQTDARLFGAAFAQGEQFPDDLLGFAQDHGSAGLQLGVALLEGQVSRPELGDHGDIQEPVSGQALQKGFEFICRQYSRGRERGKWREREKQSNVRSSEIIYVNKTL